MHGTFADKTAEKHRLTYREIAAHFGISADAARMKAKRKAKAGRWAIIPGNHPSDTVRVEIPADDLAERVGGEQPERNGRERSPRTREGEQPNAIAEQMLASLTEAQARIRHLTDQLIEAKEAQGRDAAELAAAETRELGTKAELERALADLAALERQLASYRRPLWRKAFGLPPKKVA